MAAAAAPAGCMIIIGSSESDKLHCHDSPADHHRMISGSARYRDSDCGLPVSELELQVQVEPPWQSEFTVRGTVAVGH
jgi:hypothetical protein